MSEKKSQAAAQPAKRLSPAEYKRLKKERFLRDNPGTTAEEYDRLAAASRPKFEVRCSANGSPAEQVAECKSQREAFTVLTATRRILASKYTEATIIRVATVHKEVL